jgi:DNA repair exonuclease SbcCD ATPase subunit
MVLDVNTDYFERHGGYDYARAFYEEAYRYAVNEVGGEQFILSAVLHADERNAALSEKLGRDVYHYHLHVVYVPVVEKREYFRQKKGAPESERKLKAVYSQISHAKKWPNRVPVVRDGKAYIVNSYSLLQDRYFEHMRAAGFDGFERGERGSTKEHLDVIGYKIQQDTERLEAIRAEIKEQKTENANLGKEAKEKRKQLAEIDKEIKEIGKAKATIEEVENMGRHNPITQNTTFSADETKKLKKLAMKSVTAADKVREAERKCDTAVSQLATVTEERDKLKAEKNRAKPSVLAELSLLEKFKKAMARAPKKLMAAIEEILRQPPELKEPQPEKNKKMEVSR